MKRRGLSPVVATVLLISVAVLLAIIVLFWARSFVSERIEKFGEPIENACDNVNIEVSRVSNEKNLINIVNKGNVAVYGVEVFSKNGFSTRKLGGGDFSDGLGLPIGSTKKVEVTSDLPDEEIKVIPRVLGQTSKGDMAYTCDDDAAKTIKAV
jgi:flagellin-like protein